MGVDFVGVGAPRCGTSWIAECLMEHPEICFPYTKELNYFSHTRGGNRSEYEISGIEGYEKLFADCGDRKKKGEFSTYYMIDDNVATIIKKHFPKIKIIISLRNPIERAFSDWKNVKFSHLKEPRDFAQAFDKQKGLDSYKERGMYFKQVKKYLDLFGEKNVKIIFTEDIYDNSARVIKELYRFLEVNEDFVPSILNKKINVSGQTTQKSSKRVLNLASSVYRNLEKTFFGNVLADLKRKTRINEKIWRKHEGSVKKIEVKMSQEARKKLIGVYFEDVEKLEKLIKRDLSKWKV